MRIEYYNVVISIFNLPMRSYSMVNGLDEGMGKGLCSSFYDNRIYTTIL